MKVLFSISFGVFSLLGFSKVTLPVFFSDNMVLQQNSKVKIWGWTTNTSEKITVTNSWTNTPVAINAIHGQWSVELLTPKGSFRTYTITIEGSGEKRVLNNVLIGEVWLCSGQSNMEWSAAQGLINKDEEIKKADFPNIRFFAVDKRMSVAPQDQLSGQWTVCTPETMPHFSAVAYFFAKEIQKKINLPVGLIGTYWGGTAVESWIPAKKVESDDFVKEGVKKISFNNYRPSAYAVCYNAMIHPFVGYNLAGFLWYQGESNVENPMQYYKAFPLLISSWGELWGKELPFYFVQIAPYAYTNEKTPDADKLNSAIVRDAQLQTMLRIPNTGMAVTNDIGDVKDIHPINKKEVGYRLALWALAKTYNVKDIKYSGPVYKSKKITGNKITIAFDYAEGLNAKGGKPKEFEIAGQDGKFYVADAQIKGNTVEVSSKQVKSPVHVRFAFTDIALPNVYNGAGLPASAFTTENFLGKIPK